jgi:hypothetical protein
LNPPWSVLEALTNCGFFVRSRMKHVGLVPMLEIINRIDVESILDICIHLGKSFRTMHIGTRAMNYTE